MYLSILSFILIASCAKIDDYKKFVEGGEISYTGKIDSVKVYPGDGRVLIQGLFRSDPKVTSCRIYWNGLKDSLEVPVTRTGGTDTVKQFIQLPENLYNFQIYTYDALGNKSVPVYATGRSYGDAYKTSLSNRLVLSAVINANNDVTINWRNIDKTLGAFATEITYTDNSNNEQRVTTSVNTTTSLLKDCKTGAPLKYRTLYLPDTLAIDTFYTAYRSYQNFMFDKTNWKVVDFSSNHGGNDNRVENFIDGTAATRWHTLVGRTYPHFAVVDMQGKKTITGFGLQITTYEKPDGDNRAPDTFQMLVSDDNVTWSNLGTFNFNRFLNAEQLYNLGAPITARYFKFIGVTGPENNMVLGEINIYGY
ncbi:hypothetical protein GCM10027516_11500 [Niabella aquatica]